MGAEQFSTPVRGASGTPISVAQTGTIETDNYDEGGAFDYDGSAYPYTVNPAATIQEVSFTEADDIVARITTTSGTTFDFPLKGVAGVWDKWTIDELELRDPNGTGAPVAGGWAGE